MHRYKQHHFEVTPILSVDVVLLTIIESELCVALHTRENAPFAGTWALPGGFIHAEDDSAMAAAARVLKGKTNVESPYLEEFGTFSGPARDPRMRFAPWRGRLPCGA